MGQAVVGCHGVLLTPEEAEDTDENHKIFVERVEDEYYVQIEHEITKRHYISFIAAASSDRIQMVKLYPEGNAGANGCGICFCCKEIETSVYRSTIMNNKYIAACGLDGGKYCISN